jgi:hypothetical protein
VRVPSVLFYINPKFRKKQSCKLDLERCTVSQERTIRDSWTFIERLLIFSAIVTANGFA